MSDMAFKIGFSALEERDGQNADITPPAEETLPRRSVVQVRFPDRGVPLSYYNDRFDLHCGDLVFVEGKLEGKRGIVTGVEYNFQIRLSDYKRVIAVADTNVTGQFHMAGSHLITFDRNALPRKKAASWFKAPAKPEEEYVSGSDEVSFPLQNLAELPITSEKAERGNAYYMENRVRYLCLDGTKGYAIVEGTSAYDVEFTYAEGAVSAMTCSCYCAGVCKHEFAALLQLRESLEGIIKNYTAEYDRTEYFASVGKETFVTFAIGSKKTGTITL